jgi:hypothetical protein
MDELLRRLGTPGVARSTILQVLGEPDKIAGPGEHPKVP